MVRDHVAGAKVTGSVTNPGDFEVTVNGQLIYSKRQTGTFPDANAVVKEITAVAGGKTPEKVTRNENPCAIL